VRGIELLDQLDDAVLEMADGDVVAARKLDLLDLAGERIDQSFELRRYRSAVLAARGQGIGKRADALVEPGQYVAGGARIGDAVDLFRQHRHVAGEASDRFVGGDVGGNLPQRGDRAL